MSIHDDMYLSWMLMGKERAAIKIFEDLWRKRWELKPCMAMLDLEEEIIDMKRQQTRESFFVTIRPRDEDISNEDERLQFRDACAAIKNRKWVKCMIEQGFEMSDDGTGFHFHGLFRLNRNYTPGQMAQMFKRGVFRHWCHDDASIEIKKICNADIPRVINYIRKDFDDSDDEVIV